MPPATDHTTAEEGVRLDKWLWAARFFKTRPLAVEAIRGGKVHCNGQRSKPARMIRAGDRLCIRKASCEWEIEIRAVCGRRKSAKEAALLYLESPESLERRQLQEERIRLERAANPSPRAHRPNKRERRLIHRFVGK